LVLYVTIAKQSYDFFSNGVNSITVRALLIIFALFWLARLVGEIAFPGGSIGLGIVLFLCVLIYLIPAIIIKNGH